MHTHLEWGYLNGHNWYELLSHISGTKWCQSIREGSYY